MTTELRQYEPDDLPRVVELWQRAGQPPLGVGGITLDQAVELMRSEPALALIGETEGDVVGLAFATANGALAWLHDLTIAPELPGPELAGELLAKLEERLAQRGIRKLVAIAHPNGSGASAELLQLSGFEPHDDTTYMELQVPAAVPVRSELVSLGGLMIGPELWADLRGLEEAKRIIEHHVIMPLAKPELAARHAVAPPKAIVLFGPPGTGKTTFAKGIASRLGWPFVEIHPSELAGEGADREAKLLTETFNRILALPSAVAFVDEVEDLAANRVEERRVGPSITNEFLKQIPRVRQAPEHLLVCATNWVGRLDSAFLRPGRFDYVLPVGPPDAEARAAIWERYVGQITDEEIDLGELVGASELFTPADIEFAARKAAHRAFERESLGEASHRARIEDFLEAIRRTKPTLSADMVTDFNEETERFTRY